MESSRDSRALILARAAALFSSRGFDATPVSELVEAAGLTKPALYHWFGSKRGLLDALIEERGRPFLAAATAGAGRESDVRLGLELSAFALIRAAREDPEFARLRLSLSFAPPESEAARAAADFNSALRGGLAAFFRRAEAYHGNMRGRSAAFAASLLAVLDARLGMELTGEGRLSDQNIREILRQFMHGIFS